jgi:hypothetical protein
MRFWGPAILARTKPRGLILELKAAISQVWYRFSKLEGGGPKVWLGSRGTGVFVLQADQDANEQGGAEA